MEFDKRVLISIPTAADIRAETVGWTVRTILHAHEKGYHAGLSLSVSSYPIDFIRNSQVIDFLGTSYNYLFLLDSDCLPTDDCIDKLLAYDLDIVSSVAPGMIEAGLVYTAAQRVRESGDHQFRMFSTTSPDLPKGLQEVDGVGSTGILIKRNVFETIPYPWYKVVVEEDHTIVSGEDFYFCTRAKEYGFKVYADYDLRQKHYKTIALT